MASSLRSAGSAFLILAGFALALFLLLEVCARVVLFGAAGLDPRRIDSVGWLGESGFLVRSPDPEIGFELAPNADGWFKLVPFRTNSRGLRDREYALEKPPNTFRVAVLGSSYTLPTGVEIERAYHSVLEDRLNAESSGLAYEFINFAVGAYQPAQLLAVLELRALAYDPDLILFELTRMSSPFLLYRKVDPRTFYTPGPRRHAFFDCFLLELVRSRLGAPRKPRTVLHRAAEKASEAAQEHRGPMLVERLGEVGRRTGIPIVVVRLEVDSAERSPSDDPVELEIWRQHLPFVDTRSAFAGRDLRELRIYELDPHPNAAAHAIFADVIGGFLRAKRLLGP